MTETAIKEYPKRIETLLSDINAIFSNPNHKVSEDNLQKFTLGLTKVIKESLEKAGTQQKNYLRMSNLGLPPRKLWFEINQPLPNTAPTPALEQRFLYGHVIEQLLIFLVREAGHTVENEQLEVELDGVPGHIDLTIDGVVTDAKSASPYQFFKFYSPDSLKANDTFGYIPQLAGYLKAMSSKGLASPDQAAFLVENKSDAEKRLLVFNEMDLPNITKHIADTKAMLAQQTPPPICYQPEPEGKSGNMMINKKCNYCPFKLRCFSGLRAFKYANGIKYLTSVVTVPRVEEIKVKKEQEVQVDEEASFEEDIF